jgi:predicted nuclease with RNAse H fold
MDFKRVIGIGWDVGGWMGNKQGVAAVMWKVGSQELEWLGTPTQFSLPIGSLFSTQMLIEEAVDKNNTKMLEESLVVIGIDAPLGFPADFVQLVSGETVECFRPQREIDNKLAYRDTDRHIYNELDNKKPLSATFDKLGNNCTVAVCHINKWCKEDGYSIHPMTNNPIDKKIIIEVYPALVKPSQLGEVKSPLKELLPKNIPYPSDAYDAAICAIMAVAYGADGKFLQLPKLVHPPDHLDSVIKEGWIYHFPRGTCT